MKNKTWAEHWGWKYGDAVKQINEFKKNNTWSQTIRWEKPDNLTGDVENWLNTGQWQGHWTVVNQYRFSMADSKTFHLILSPQSWIFNHSVG